MSLLEALKLALLDLALHKFRASLAALGIIFGVASVGAMMSISEGAKRETLRHIAVLGVDNIIVRSVKPAKEDVKEPTTGRQYVAEFGLLRKDLAHIRRTFAMIRHAVGLRDMRTNLYTSGGRALDLHVMATEPEYLKITRSRVRRGRFLTWFDKRAPAKRVCVVGADAARKLFAYEDPLANSVRIGGDWYRVVGIMENRARLRAAGGDDINNYVFIPLKTAQAQYGDMSYRRESGTHEMVRVQLDAISIRLTDADAVVPTARRLEGYLAKTHKETDYELLVPMELLRQKAATQRIFSIVMGSIAGISLLVGGIGIMNIMLANVYDRRKEIGARRALGARRRDIQRQFLFQASTLTGLGGVVGVGAGYALARGVSQFAGWPTVFTPVSVILGLAVSCLVGIVFGMWPAYQAAKVNPIEALRAE